MSKPKSPAEIKIKACEEYLSGQYSAFQVCERYGMTYNKK